MSTHVLLFLVLATIVGYFFGRLLDSNNDLWLMYGGLSFGTLMGSVSHSLHVGGWWIAGGFILAFIVGFITAANRDWRREMGPRVPRWRVRLLRRLLLVVGGHGAAAPVPATLKRHAAELHEFEQQAESQHETDLNLIRDKDVNWLLEAAGRALEEQKEAAAARRRCRSAFDCCLWDIQIHFLTERIHMIAARGRELTGAPEASAAA